MFLLKEIDQLYDRFSDQVYAAGKLDKKTKELIAIACSVSVDCVPCSEWHYRQAIQTGATKDEISEALAVSMSISAGSKRAKYGPVIEKLGNEKQ
ncbi:MAG: carboxymuconolactone decarboxylase family protein [Anaerolineales bacterium]